VKNVALRKGGVRMIDIRDDEVEAFWRDGAYCLRGAIDARWVARVQDATECALAQPGPLALALSADRSFASELGLWSRWPEFHHYVFESGVSEIARRFLRTRKLNFFFDHLFVKEPGAPGLTPWHQDLPYWPVRGEQILSIWLALDAVTLATGGLEYVRGSHRWNRFFRPDVFGDYEDEEGAFGALGGDRIPDLDAARDQYEFLSWDMLPGDVLIHHARTIHGATGNSSSSTRRRGYSTRWAGDDARWDPRPGVLEAIPGPSTLPMPTEPGALLDCEAFPIVEARRIACEARREERT
jgi:ectoine hydroxylase-related dioxygenase (phytanoyl-CoA dioxygenase family)